VRESGRRFSIDAFGILGYAMMSCATLGQAVTIGLRYYRTAGPLYELDFTVEREEAIIEVRDVIGLGPLEPFLVEELFASMPPLIHELIGEPIQPRGLDLAYPAPRYAPRYREVFDCPLHFEADGNRFRFDAALLERPLVRADADNLTLFERSCRELLEEIESSETLASVVRREILASPGAIPTADAMAARLNIGARTLRLRLAALGTSYQALLDEVRCRIAVDYLQNTELSTQEIAELLGFTEATNFRRAFLRWTSHTPTAYRRPGETPSRPAGHEAVREPTWRPS